MSVDDVLRKFTFNGKFSVGIENAIKTLRPEAIYDVICSGGHFEFERWYDPNGLLPPTDEEIQKEYFFHKELFEYVNSNSQGPRPERIERKE